MHRVDQVGQFARHRQHFGDRHSAALSGGGQPVQPVPQPEAHRLAGYLLHGQEDIRVFLEGRDRSWCQSVQPAQQIRFPAQPLPAVALPHQPSDVRAGPFEDHVDPAG